MLPDIAVENKEDLDLLIKLNNFYWDKVREALSSTINSRVEILNLGSFYRQNSRVTDLLAKKVNTLNLAIKNNRPRTIEAVEKDIEYLKQIQDCIESERLRRRSVKDKRNGCI